MPDPNITQTSRLGFLVALRSFFQRAHRTIFYSIRARLQAWYVVTLLLVISCFAGLFYLQSRSAMLREIDARLFGAARYLHATLRQFPPNELDETSDATDSLRPVSQSDESLSIQPSARRARNVSRRLWDSLDLGVEHSGPPAEKEDSLYYAVWRRDGSPLKTSDRRLVAESAPETLPNPTAQTGEAYFGLGSDDRRVLLGGPRGSLILVGTSLLHQRRQLATLAWQLIGAAGVALSIGSIGGWLISARALRPLTAISATAATISSTNLSRRIDLSDVDHELTGLGEILNDTFSRLESSFERQARFTSDASHELRTPLAIIHAHLELALSRQRSVAEYRQTLHTCLVASTRMRSLVEGLLTLACADADSLHMKLQCVDLAALVKEVAAQNALQAEAAQVKVCLELSHRPVMVAGDAAFLARVPANLLENALRYTPPGGFVRLILATDGPKAVLRVRDTGCGIAPADQPYVFDRFFRADKARSRASGGKGLGLAICKSLVEAHRGSLSFQSHRGYGSEFVVRLPLLRMAD